MLALLFVTALVLATGGQVQPRAAEVGETVSVIVSKLNPFDRTPEAAVEQMGGSVGQELPIVDGFLANVPADSVDDLAELDSVRGVTTNAKVRVEAQYGENSGVASAVYTDVTRASKAWGQGTTGKGVTVALIDTGVDVTGDLAGRVIGAADFSGENEPYKDTYGHGTFVAGLIAGTGAGSNGAIKGVAPEANIFSVKIAGRDGSTDLFRLLAALEFVAIHKDAFGIRVLNLSLGTDSTQSYKVDPLNFAVERVWNSGIAVVVAAGNSGKILKPADDPFVITVGAADDKTTVGRSDDIVASFSGVGPTLSDGLAKPDVLASGRSVVSSRAPGSTIATNFPNAVIGDRYFKGSGTSGSSAVVAGAAALVIQKMWSLNPNQIKHRLMSTAKPLANASSMQQGTGSVDAYNAVVSTDTTAANQGVQPAGGWGSLQASSGSYCYRDSNGACLSDETLIGTSGFDPNVYYGPNWGGSKWTGTAWTGTAWTGTAWTGTAWTGTAWTGTAWTGTAWTGTAWTGTAWTGTAWTGSDWATQEWMNSSWMGTAWTGTAWSGTAWTGTAWTGTAWTGTAWTGTAWTGTAWTADISWLGTHWT
ncbi:MAG TPA: S8 family serine peptidase [Acidimicrobiales bacterium]|nr:S8 family serine peptidase [Acidimicrobiales bacterium]